MWAFREESDLFPSRIEVVCEPGAPGRQATSQKKSSQPGPIYYFQQNQGAEKEGKGMPVPSSQFALAGAAVGVCAALLYGWRRRRAELQADSFDAVVYGAGPVGAAVALGLQQKGHHSACARSARSMRWSSTRARASICRSAHAALRCSRRLAPTPTFSPP